MKRNEKTNVVSVAVATSTDQAEANKMTVLKTDKIEEATIVDQPKQQVPKPNLSETMRIIDELHLKTRHRNKLEVYGDMLKALQIEQVEEDLEQKYHYAGCSLKITDDRNDKFELRHPVLISEVVDFLRSKFSLKLAEIEAEIILP